MNKEMKKITLTLRQTLYPVLSFRKIFQQPNILEKKELDTFLNNHKKYPLHQY
jgi:hypothetical protein